MYWNWITSTTPVPQPPANYTPGYPNQYCVHPSTYSYPQTNYYQANYQQTNYLQTNHGQINYQQTSYQQKVLVSLPSQVIPTVVIDDDDDDEAEVNKHDLEITKPKLQLSCYNQIKCEVPKDFQDWTELTVKEDSFSSGSAVKKENEGGPVEREWIDWTELNVKEEIEECNTAKGASSEECVISEDPVQSKKTSSEDSEEGTALQQLSLVVENLKKESRLSEERVIIDDSEVRTSSIRDSGEVIEENLKKEPTSIEDSEECTVIEDLEKGPTDEETHIEHVTVEELEPAPRYPPSEQLKCDHCDYETEWRSCLSRHLTTKHKDITPELNNHEEESSPTTKETADGKFHCPDCSYRTDWKSNLNKHIISRHTTSEKIQWYECAHCPYKGKTKEYLRVHLVSHGKLGQWHKCPHCTFKSKQRYVVNNHIIVTHTDDEKVKWYKCSHCLYKAKLLANLKKHVANQHIEEDQIKWFKCEHCHYKAKNRKGLRLHTLNRHTKHDQIEWHVCNKCGHKIKTRKNLMQHLKTCKGKGVSPPVKSETREVLVYMGDKLCFRRVPVDNRVNEKHKLCKCKHCKP